MSKTLEQLLEALARPFPAKDIKWKGQRHVLRYGKEDCVSVAPYITAREVMERLDEVFGLGGWKDEYFRWDNGAVRCRISVKVNDEWISREDGTNEGQGEVGIKGAFSDAFKRAGVKFGIGRYIYGAGEFLVPLTPKMQYSNDRYFADNKKNKRGYWTAPDLPDEFLPEEDRGQPGRFRGEPLGGLSRTRQVQQPRPVQPETLKALRGFVDTAFPQGDGVKKLAPILERVFKKSSFEELTDAEAKSFLHDLQKRHRKAKGA